MSCSASLSELLHVFTTTTTLCSFRSESRHIDGMAWVHITVIEKLGLGLAGERCRAIDVAHVMLFIDDMRIAIMRHYALDCARQS